MSAAQGRRVAIVGGGLVGSLLACYLGRRGYLVDVYERRPDPRSMQPERGRSINLALSERGIDALRGIDLVDTVLAPALPMHGRMVHDRTGQTNFQSYSAGGDRAINSIGRGTLNETLLDAAEATPGVTLHFDVRTNDYGLGSNSLTLARGSEGQDVEVVEPDIVIAADGFGSAVRQSLEMTGRMSVQTVPEDHGYKELTIPAVDGEFALDPDALHIWPRGTSMMIALPNPDRSFTCTLFWPRVELEALTTEDEILTHFAEVYPDAVPLMPTLVEDYLANPNSMLATLYVDPWQADGKVAVIGDAAHAILPFFGQGANAGFEDVVELNRCLDETDDDWALALPLYQQRRKPNADAIAWLAKDNFVEMRDRVASPSFRATKTVEHALERLLPGRYLSRYEMVSFTTIPYAEVIERDRRQRTTVLATAAGLGALAVGTVIGLAGRAARRG